jgi:hypothetical protein
MCGEQPAPEPVEGDDEMRSFAWEFGDLDEEVS